MSTSFKSAARHFKSGPYIINYLTKFQVAVIALEAAHAISRGRKPTSSSLLPGVNLVEWWRDRLYGAEGQDYYGDPYPIIWDACNSFEEMSEFPHWKAANKAIYICNRYFNNVVGLPKIKLTDSEKRQRIEDYHYNRRHERADCCDHTDDSWFDHDSQLLEI